MIFWCWNVYIWANILCVMNNFWNWVVENSQNNMKKNKIKFQRHRISSSVINCYCCLFQILERFCCRCLCNIRKWKVLALRIKSSVKYCGRQRELNELSKYLRSISILSESLRNLPIQGNLFPINELFKHAKRRFLSGRLLF